MVTKEAAHYSFKLDQNILERGATKINQKDYTCAVCGKSVETIGHLILQCGSIHPDVDARTVSSREALGFKDKKDNVNKSAADLSKKRLDDWWYQNRAVT